MQHHLRPFWPTCGEPPERTWGVDDGRTSDGGAAQAVPRVQVFATTGTVPRPHRTQRHPVFRGRTHRVWGYRADNRVGEARVCWLVGAATLGAPGENEPLAQLCGTAKSTAASSSVAKATA
jgi:hypothetical protein